MMGDREMEDDVAQLQCKVGVKISPSKEYPQGVRIKSAVCGQLAEPAGRAGCTAGGLDSLSRRQNSSFLFR